MPTRRSRRFARRPTRPGGRARSSLTLVGDLETPVAAFLKLRAGHAGPAFLLESVEGGAVRGRYSMIGLEPDLVWRCRDGAAEIAARRRTADAFVPEAGAPLESLRALIAESAIAERAGDGAAADGGRPVRLSRLRHGAADGAPAGRRSPTRSACRTRS